MYFAVKNSNKDNSNHVIDGTFWKDFKKGGCEKSITRIYAVIRMSIL